MVGVARIAKTHTDHMYAHVETGIDWKTIITSVNVSREGLIENISRNVESFCVLDRCNISGWLQLYTSSFHYSLYCMLQNFTLVLGNA